MKSMLNKILKMNNREIRTESCRRVSVRNVFLQLYLCFSKVYIPLTKLASLSAEGTSLS